MKRILARFLLSLSILLLLLAAWVIFAAGHMLVNPDAQTVAEISDSAIIIYQDQGEICFFVDEQTGKVRARVSTAPPVPLAFRMLYQSASCKTNGSEVTCSRLAVFDVKKAQIYMEPWFIPSASISAFTGPIPLQEGTYDVYIGANYKGRMIVTIGKNMSGPWCQSPMGTLDFVIPPTPTPIQREKQILTPTIFEGYPASPIGY